MAGRAAVFLTAHLVSVAPPPRVGVPSSPCAGSGGQWASASAVRAASGLCFGGASWRACASGGRAVSAGGWGVAGPSVVAWPSCVCALVPVVAPSWSVPRTLVLPLPRLLMVSCPRVVLSSMPCPCGRLPATLGLSSPPCRGVLSLALPFACPCIFPSRCKGGVVGWGACGAPLANAWGWVVWSHRRRVSRGGWGRRPWTAARMRASLAACGMTASGAACCGLAGVGMRISSKVYTMFTPSRLPAPPAHLIQRRSSRKAGADHQARWAGPWGGKGSGLEVLERPRRGLGVKDVYGRRREREARCCSWGEGGRT